jgi:hypothetical protein
MAEQRKEVFEYFDPNKGPADAILIGATKVRRQNLTGPGQVQDVISIQPVYATAADSFRIFEQFEPNYRKALAQKLKSAGYYRGPITGEATRDLREAYLDAQSELNAENTQRLLAFGEEGQQDLDNIETFLTRQSRGKGGDKGPKTVVYEKEYRPEDLEQVIQKVYLALEGRGASVEEVEKYLPVVQKQAAKPENMAQVTTTPFEGGVARQKTREAFDPEDFLIKELSGTDTARARKVYSLYEAFDSFVGRG